MPSESSTNQEKNMRSANYSHCRDCGRDSPKNGQVRCPHCDSHLIEPVTRPEYWIKYRRKGEEVIVGPIKESPWIRSAHEEAERAASRHSVNADNGIVSITRSAP